jgi:transcriptional regulator with XRE-family HTH domain
MKNRLRVKEIVKHGNDNNIFTLRQSTVASICIPFEMTDNSKAQLLAKWNNGKALQKLTCEVLYKLRETLGCTYGELIGTPYNKAPKDLEEELFLIKMWIKYDEQEQDKEKGLEKNTNILDSLVKLSNEYKCAIDFIFLTPEENQMI